MSGEITNPDQTDAKSTSHQTVNCPDCQKEYPKPKPGTYKCAQCFCKFTFETDQTVTIIPFFDEMKLEPILVMLSVLGIVVLVAMGDKYLSLMERLNFFLLFVAGIFGSYKIAQALCRRYRGVDRFFRRISRPRFLKDHHSLIDMDDHSE